MRRRQALDQVDVGHIRIGARRGRQARPLGPHIVNRAVVTQDHVVAVTGIDDIAEHRTDGASRESVVPAEHHVVAGAGRDVVRAAVSKGRRLNLAHRNRGVRLAGKPVREFVRRGDDATVADRDIVALTGVDRVAVAPADHDVVAAARGDGVDAAVLRRREALDQIDVRSIRVRTLRAQRRSTVHAHVINLPIVAQDDVGAHAGADELDGAAVRAVVVATERDVVAHTGGDVVAAAIAEGNCLDQPEGHRHACDLRRVLVRCGNAATVANHQVRSVPGVDRVAETPADHDVTAAARGDLVDAASRNRQQALNQVNVGCVVVRTGCRRAALQEDVIDGRIVTDDHIVAVAGIDDVSEVATEDDIVAAQGRDGIDATVAKFNRFDPAHRDGLGAETVRSRIFICGDDLAAVTDHQVSSASGLDLVVVPSTDDDVVAAAGRDLVGATIGGRGQALDQVDVRRIRIGTRHRAVAVLAGKFNGTVITEDHIVTITGAHRVVVVAAEDEVVPGPGRDGVSPADAKFRGFDAAQRHRNRGEAGQIRIRRRDNTAVADDDVMAVADGKNVSRRAADHDIRPGSRGDSIAAAIREIGRGNYVDVRRVPIGDDEVNGAIVTEDDVVLDARRDGIAGTAAEDDVVAVASFNCVHATGNRVARPHIGDGERDRVEPS